MPFKWFSKKKKKDIKQKVLYEGFVKRMDVRYGSFLWLKDRDSDKEFVGDISIERVVIDLPDGLLSKKIHTKTKEGLVKKKLRYILENFGDRKHFFKFIQFSKPVYVVVKGELGGDVEVLFTTERPESAEGTEEEEEEEKIEQDEESPS